MEQNIVKHCSLYTQVQSLRICPKRGSTQARILLRRSVRMRHLTTAINAVGKRIRYR